MKRLRNDRSDESSLFVAEGGSLIVYVLLAEFTIDPGRMFMHGMSIHEVAHSAAAAGADALRVANDTPE